MNKPTKPNITIPESFAANGVKADFDNNKILNGFDRIQPDALAGDNLNKFIDDTYKGLNYGIKGVDYLEERWKSQITNCLLEVPQRVKLELNAGVLTLKAGSQVIMPNGFEEDGVTPKFDEVVIESDITNTSIAGAKTYMVIYTPDNNSIGWTDVTMTYSGTSDSAINGSLYYNTGLNTCTQYTSVGNRHHSSFPLAIVVSDGSTGFTSINQTFNGFGYIDSTVWVDKGVKGLIPNGRNEDGTLNNIEYTTSKVAIRDVGLTNTDCTYAVLTNNRIVDYRKLVVSETQPTTTYTLWYKPSENILYTTRNTGEAPWILQGFAVLDCYRTSTTISNFNPKQPFRAVDWSDIKNSINGGEIGKPQISLDSNLPSGCVWLEGSTVSRTTYSKLFAIYGTTYGAGDGSTTFVLPDFRNRAIWGSNGFGYIGAGLPNIAGTYTPYAGSGNSAYGFPSNSNGTGAFYRTNLNSNGSLINNSSSSAARYGIGFSASNSNSIYGSSTTVQPPAIKVRVYTRYQ